jgi:predicted CopG family antitoxin
MKTLNLTFEDKIFKKLKKFKEESKKSWENFFIRLILG